MHTTIRRRDFLAGSAAALSAATLLQADDKEDKPKKSDEPIFKISLAQWSLNRRFFGREKPQLDNLEFAKTARSLGIEAIEYVNQFFYKKAEDQEYLAEMKKRAADEGVKSLLIMIDREGDLGHVDDAKRKQAVENHLKWLAAAKTLGCHAIRVNARSDPKRSFDEQMKLAADGLRSLTQFGDKVGIDVIVENHGGLSSNGKWLSGVIKMVDHERCGTLPDFGNFAINRSKDEWYDRYQGVKELMPYAKAVSAKSYEFDKDKRWSTIDRRNKKETDFLKMMTIVLDAGYRGWVGIESEGPQGQIGGVKDTKQLLERVRAELTPKYS